MQLKDRGAVVISTCGGRPAKPFPQRKGPLPKDRPRRPVLGKRRTSVWLSQLRRAMNWLHDPFRPLIVGIGKVGL